MSLLSILDKIDVCVGLLADDVWEAEDDKIGIFSVEMDIFDQLFFEEQPISLHMVQNSTKIENMKNEDEWESSINQNIEKNWWMIKIYFG